MGWALVKPLCGAAASSTLSAQPRTWLPACLHLTHPLACLPTRRLPACLPHTPTHLPACREVTQGEDDDGPAAGGYFDDDEDGDNDVNFDAGEEDLLGAEEQQQEEEGAEQGVGVRGGYRRAKAVALQRLAEIAHLEHQRGYPH